MIRQTAFALAAASLLAACAENNTGVGQNTAVGAVLGGAVGAVTGALVTKKDRRGALIGAGVGAVAGAAIGNYLDRQQQDLERNLEGTGATVSNNGEELLVNLPAGVTFGFDSARIQPQFFDPLARVANTLNQYESSLIDVIGHTDSTGSDSYNQDLSQRRADAVASFLRNRGVLSQRIVAYGVGESQPVASNSDEFGRSQNRRVELRITPISEGA